MRINSIFIVQIMIEKLAHKKRASKEALKVIFIIYAFVMLCLKSLQY